MNIRQSFAAWIAALFVLPLVSIASCKAQADTQNVAVPAYFYPPSYWAQMDAGAPTVSVAVANVDSGPGSEIDPNYATAIQDAQDAGITVIGYVNTANGNTLIPLATVEAQVDQWMDWYNVDGIFFDDARTTPANEAYYRALKTYVKNYSSSDKVALNPGTAVTDSNYGNLADILVTFEGKYADYISADSSDYNRYISESWYSNYGPHRFWHIVIDCPTDAKMQKAVRLSESRRAGYVYVTNDTTPNPYDTLPSDPYWSDELAKVAAY